MGREAHLDNKEDFVPLVHPALRGKLRQVLCPEVPPGSLPHPPELEDAASKKFHTECKEARSIGSMGQESCTNTDPVKCLHLRLFP